MKPRPDGPRSWVSGLEDIATEVLQAGAIALGTPMPGVGYGEMQEEAETRPACQTGQTRTNR